MGIKNIVSIKSFTLSISFILFQLIGPKAESIVFERVIDRPATGELRRELAVTDLNCGVHSKFNVALLPVSHVGEMNYYHWLEEILDEQDLVLFESVRPAGFFGPPFEFWPVELGPFNADTSTRLRLRSVQATIGDFIKEKGRGPSSLDEVYLSGVNELRYMSSMLFDAWGKALLLTQKNGEDTVVSLGEDGIPSEDDLFGSELGPRPKSDGVRAIRLLYRQMANKAGLTAQYDFTVYTRPNSYNADVSVDIPFPVNNQGEIVASETGWLFRNKFAPLKLSQLMMKTTVSVKKVGIIYGVGHMQDFLAQLDQLFRCSVTSQTWKPIIVADEGLTGVTVEQFKERVRMIRESQMSEIFESDSDPQGSLRETLER